MVAPANLPSVVNIFARLVVVIGPTFAPHACMRKPNPEPSADNRKLAWDLEYTPGDLRPFTVVSISGPNPSAFDS